MPSYTEWRDSETTYANCGNGVFGIADGRTQSTDPADWADACEGAHLQFLSRTGSGAEWDIYGSDGTFGIESGIDVLDVQYFLDHPPDLAGIAPVWDTQFLTDPAVTGVEWEEPQGTRLDQWRVAINFIIDCNNIDPTDLACVGQVRRGNDTLYYPDGTTLDSYRVGALPMRSVQLNHFLTGAELAGLLFEFGEVAPAPDTFTTFEHMVLFNDAELDSNGMFSLAYSTSYQINHTLPIREFGSPSTRIFSCGSELSLGMLYLPPRYRLVLSTRPPLRQWPRDDGLRRIPPRFGVAGPTSRQGSIRRGPRGTYT